MTIENKNVDTFIDPRHIRPERVYTFEEILLRNKIEDIVVVATDIHERAYLKPDEMLDYLYKDKRYTLLPDGTIILAYASEQAWIKIGPVSFFLMPMNFFYMYQTAYETAHRIKESLTLKHLITIDDHLVCGLLWRLDAEIKPKSEDHL